MTVERAVRLTAGIVILASLVFAHYFTHKWLWLTAFAGLNLLQSAFTNWCPAMSIFRALEVRDGEECGGEFCKEKDGCCCGLEK